MQTGWQGKQPASSCPKIKSEIFTNYLLDFLQPVWYIQTETIERRVVLWKQIPIHLCCNKWYTLAVLYGWNDVVLLCIPWLNLIRLFMCFTQDGFLSCCVCQHRWGRDSCGGHAGPQKPTLLWEWKHCAADGQCLTSELSSYRATQGSLWPVTKTIPHIVHCSTAVSLSMRRSTTLPTVTPKGTEFDFGFVQPLNHDSEMKMKPKETCLKVRQLWFYSEFKSAVLLNQYKKCINEVSSLKINT